MRAPAPAGDVRLHSRILAGEDPAPRSGALRTFYAAATVHFFTVIGAHATGFLGAGVLIGLAVPPLAHALRPLLMPAMMIPLVLALVRLDWGAFGAYAGGRDSSP